MHRATVWCKKDGRRVSGIKGNESQGSGNFVGYDDAMCGCNAQMRCYGAVLLKRGMAGAELVTRVAAGATTTMLGSVWTQTTRIWASGGKRQTTRGSEDVRSQEVRVPSIPMQCATTPYSSKDETVFK